MVTPFPPSRRAGHGGARLLVESLLHLTARHDVALVTLVRRGDPWTDGELVDRLAIHESVPAAPIGLSPVRLARERRRVLSILRGEPAWAVGSDVAEMHRRVAEVVEAWSPHVVQVEFRAMAPYGRDVPDGVPLVLVDHDASPDEGDDAAAAWARLAARTLPRFERVVSFTERDRLVNARYVGGARSVCIRPGADLPSRRDAAGTDGEMLFVGSFDHGPNLEAARRLVTTIVPLVRDRVPRASLTIVGRGADPSWNDPSSGVTCTEWVDDLAPCLDRAAVVVAPVTTGGGIRIKVIEALGAGKAIVTTQRGVEGLAVVDGVHVLVRDEDAAFADAVAELLENLERRMRLADAAREWAEANLGWTAVIDRYDELFRELRRERRGWDA